VRLEADHPAESNRLLALCGALFVFPKVLLALPHLFVLTFVGLAAQILAYVSYWIVLITGKYPEGLHNFVKGALRWQFRVSAWIFGLVDEYPPFSLE
jgi:hypothetical protein